MCLPRGRPMDRTTIRLFWDEGGRPVGATVRAGGVRHPDSGGAQVAAEAMPYISLRPADCNTGRRAIRNGPHPPLAGRPQARSLEPAPGPVRTSRRRPPSREVASVGVEYQVERLGWRIVVTVYAGSPPPWPLDPDRWTPPTSCASWSIYPRRACSSPSRDATWSEERSSPFDHQSGPAVSSVRSTSWSWTRRMTRTVSPTRCSRKSSSRRETRRVLSSRQPRRPIPRSGPAGNGMDSRQMVRR